MKIKDPAWKWTTFVHDFNEKQNRWFWSNSLVNRWSYNATEFATYLTFFRSVQKKKTFFRLSNKKIQFCSFPALVIRLISFPVPKQCICYTFFPHFWQISSYFHNLTKIVANFCSHFISVPIFSFCFPSAYPRPKHGIMVVKMLDIVWYICQLV